MFKRQHKQYNDIFLIITIFFVDFLRIQNDSKLFGNIPRADSKMKNKLYNYGSGNTSLSVFEFVHKKFKKYLFGSTYDIEGRLFMEPLARKTRSHFVHFQKGRGLKFIMTVSIFKLLRESLIFGTFLSNRL